MDKTVEKVEKKRTNPNTWGLGINHCPKWLVLGFINKSKSSYGNQHWALLLDMWRKSEAYDSVIGTPISEVVEEVEEKNTIATFGKEEIKVK